MKFDQDSTFTYVTNELHPTFYRWEPFSEKGKWTLSGDTIILNPHLTKKIFVESEFVEEEHPDDTSLLLTFNHIRRFFGINGNIIKTDTVQIDRLDYSFNELKKKKLTRVAPHMTTRCTFAGYIPKEIITSSRTVFVQRPTENMKSIFIGCYELQGTKEFFIKNQNSNHLTLNVYSNYYKDGQIRQMKFLIKNDKYIYTRQKKNGEFDKDNIWIETDAKLKRQKDGG
ncbi:MAG: hypothetical protein ACHQFX_07250 [Chitinophagales bacterium]